MSSRPEFSVIVPTYERMDVLPEVLDAIEAQEDAPPFELVVVDDGSGDETPDFLEGRTFTVPSRVLRQANAGPSAARNAGVAAARGRRVAFLGDDTVPSKGWLGAHAAAHEARGGGPELAVIGYTSWHPRLRVTPFLDYINEHGLQFGYALIDDREDVPFNFFYTSNLSLDRQMLLDEPFDERFPYPAWEDIEVSYRLKNRGLRLIYEPAATVAHDHPTTLSRFSSRQEKAGYSAVVFYRLHPELGGFLGLGPDGPPELPSRGRQVLREILARALQLLPGTRSPRLWNELLRYHYIAGLQRGWQEDAGLDLKPSKSPEARSVDP